MSSGQEIPSEYYGYLPVPPDATKNAARQWWDANARDYLAEHGEYLGDSDFCWCPEGIRESHAHLLGDISELATMEVLEIGAGAAQCSRWLAAQGISVVASDISQGMLEHARGINIRTGIDVPLVHADARNLPFDANSFDIVFTAYGAIPFVADVDEIHREVNRVLKPSGRWVFSTTHPIRWAFPDVPGEAGLTASRRYFDTAPYIETDSSGNVTYAEYHRTLGTHIRSLIAAGFEIRDLIEPEWPHDVTETWGGWSPLRGKYLPGTLIVVSHKQQSTRRK